MSEFTRLVDLASARLGGRVIAANDEFFAPKENLLKASKPILIEDKYTSRGKWMDGWETRRRRSPGYDWCVIRLGLPGMIRGVVVDTSFFRGNYPEHFSLEACDLGIAPRKNESARLNDPELRWLELLPTTALKGDSRNCFPVELAARFTHVRLKIYPDGGVARLRVHGEVVPDRERLEGREIDLAAVENGGSIVVSSDEFFSEPLNLLMPGRGRNMGDGWETRRRRGPGHDWVIVKLGIPGTIKRIEVDTAHFKGNFPESCSVQTRYADTPADEKSISGSEAWKQVLPRTSLAANRRHIFENQLEKAGAATHIRFNIFPDGGVSRLRVFGRPERRDVRPGGIDRLNALPVTQARRLFQDCCGSKSWSGKMVAKRPFASAEELMQAADSVWAGLGREHWLEAFRHHPPIGKKNANERRSAMERQWSAGEQSAARNGTPSAIAALAEANRTYKAKFGYVFLICATGKTSEEILRNLRQRLLNDSETELRIAAEEQSQIMRLRLRKLLAS